MQLAAVSKIDPFWSRVYDLALVDLEVLKNLDVSVEKTEDIAKEWVSRVRGIFNKPPKHSMPVNFVPRTRLLFTANNVILCYFKVVKTYLIALDEDHGKVLFFYKEMRPYLIATEEITKAQNFLEEKVRGVALEYVDLLFKELPKVLEILDSSEVVDESSDFENELTASIKSLYQVQEDALMHLNPILNEREVIDFSELAKNYNTVFKLESNKGYSIQINRLLKNIFHQTLQGPINSLETALSNRTIHNDCLMLGQLRGIPAGQDAF